MSHEKISNAERDSRQRYRRRRLRLHPERERKVLRMRLKRLMRLKDPGIGAPPAPSDGQREEMDALRRHCAALQNDLEAIRRRQKREREHHRKFAAQPFIEALLPAMDAINQALTALEENPDPEAAASGMQGIHQLIEKALGEHGLERFNPKGETFDPNYHEALSVIPSEEHEAGQVIEVIQQGYSLNGRVIRPARVCIAQKP